MHLSLFPMLHPASNRTASTEYFVSLQGRGRKWCGGIADWYDCYAKYNQIKIL